MQHLSKSKRNVTDLRYVESEKGYFNNVWQSIRSRDVAYSIKSRNHLLELWNNHKKEYGPCCRYTGVELTTKRSTGEGWKRSRPTNISVDRVDPRLPYEEGNIVFCTWEFNNRKSGVTPDDCKRILEVYEELHARS
tara:strand:+ start:285 stop:692 length:408 start_codon:yes stop_codon:yes gene_type:complete